MSLVPVTVMSCVATRKCRTAATASRTGWKMTSLLGLCLPHPLFQTPNWLWQNLPNHHSTKSLLTTTLQNSGYRPQHVIMVVPHRCSPHGAVRQDQGCEPLLGRPPPTHHGQAWEALADQDLQDLAQHLEACLRCCTLVRHGLHGLRDSKSNKILQLGSRIKCGGCCPYDEVPGLWTSWTWTSLTPSLPLLFRISC